ncbi:MAG: hypothetical protein K6A14_03670 [Erysipelotrichaceae bacterium]|nr:hypothetical protein [Erysipelotrichaceae bacterium]
MKSTVIIRQMPKKYSSCLLETMQEIARSNHRMIMLKNAVSGEKLKASVISVDRRANSFVISYSENCYCRFLRWCKSLCHEASWYLLVQVSYSDREGLINDEFRICGHAVTLVASN